MDNSTAEARVCKFCGADISHRPKQSRFCDTSHAKKYSWIHPVRGEAKRAYFRAYRVTHREKYREYTHRYLANDPSRVERDAATRKTWNQANTDRLAVYAKRKRAAKLANSIPYTPVQLAARFAMWGGMCWMCGAIATDADHVKPLSKGGWDCLSNLRPACRSCNASKNARWYGPHALAVFIAG